MAEKTYYPYLCGGTFFVLSTHAMRERSQAKKSKSFGTSNDGLTETNCLKGLISVFDPKYIEGPDSTFASNVTKYKQCRLSSNTYLPFDVSPVVNAFDEAVTTHYNAPLSRMSAYVDSYIDKGTKGKWLVKALLELIRDDQSISDDQPFYVTPDGNPTAKANLPSLAVLQMQSFLLGVWHFIVVNRPENDCDEGKRTFAEWHKAPATRGQGYTFISSIGNDPSVLVKVVTDDVIEEAESSEEILTPSMALEGAAVDYSEFLEYEKDKYSRVKTLLYEQPHSFYSLFICSNLQLAIYRKANRGYYINTKTIENASIPKIEEITNFAFITGTGGIGKSMMMRHLLLDSIANYKERKRLPVFIPLKEYGKDSGEIAEFVYNQIVVKTPALTKEEYIRALGAGDYILLFDGLDEINSAYRGQFQTKLESFSDSYKNNTVIVSSRPFSRFIHMSRYHVFAIQPFTKKQALDLIDILEYDPVAKQKFRDELDRSLYALHKDFAENPLLLTIMLRTYEKFADIPSQIHHFYKNAYSALAQDHDSTKDLYKRPFKTRMSMERFEKYMAEFCALTYTEEKYDLTDNEARDYFVTVKNHIGTEEEKNIMASDFMEDLCINLCMMEHDGEKYYFTHRSFQEYFCAVFLSEQMDEDLAKVGEFFNGRRRESKNDKTFQMLYDMIPKKVEKYIFVPYLEKLLEGDYWSFLQKAYGDDIYLDGGEIPDWSINAPISFIYDFITTTRGIKGDLSQFDAPYISDITCTQTHSRYLRILQRALQREGS